MKTTIPLQLISPTDEFKLLMNQLMRVFCSSERYAFQRLLDGKTVNDLNKDVQVLFDLNKRYAEDTVQLASAIISSQKELLPMQIEDVQAKIEKTYHKIHLYETGQRKPKKVDLYTCLKGLQSRIQKLQTKLNDLLLHQKNKTIPSVIFGGKKNFYERKKGNITKAEWKDMRSNRVYSRGDKTKEGNLNLRLLFEDGKFYLEAAIPFGVKKGGISPRIRAEVQVPDRFFDRVVRVILPDEAEGENGKILSTYIPYTINILRKNGIYHVQLTYEETESGRELDWKETLRGDRIAGMDVNIDRIAVTILTRDGNFINSKVFYCHEMEDASSDKRQNIAGNVVKEVLRFVKEQNAEGIVLEDIQLKQQHDTDKAFNRRSHSFAKNKLLSALKRGAFRNGIKVKFVNPAYTSVIGRFKYMKHFGISVHEAASYVIGRRGMGYEERIPTEMIETLKNKVKPHLISLLGSMEESVKKSDAGKKKRQLLGMWLNKINQFKHEHPWSLWNIVHKCLGMKQYEIKLKEI